MLNLFNSTKIDKMRLAYGRKEVAPTTRMAIDNKLKKNFTDYIVCKKGANVLNRFTPTKLKRGNIIATHNLQMPLEKDFKQALKSICLNAVELAESLWITEIHLTKDVLLENPVQFYLEMLKNKPYSRLIPVTYGSDEYAIYGLYLVYDRKIDSEHSPKFRIKFYDKVVEYYKEHQTYFCKLYEPISDEDKKKLGKHYDEKTNTINLEGLNWLRIEIEFHEKNKLLPITKAISGKADMLTLATILDCKNFYGVVESVFTNIMKELVFAPENHNEDVLNGLAEIEKLACKLCGSGDEFYTLKAIAKELGLESQFSEFACLARKIKPESIFYDELERELFSEAVQEKPLQGFCVTVYSSLCSPRSYYKEYVLSYAIPIWDDS